MNILIANKFYYNRGGDCVYSMGLEKMLMEAGHKTAFFASEHPQNLPSEWSEYWISEFSTRKFMRPFGDKETKIKFAKLLNDFKPDILHLNNIHTQISPIIAEIAHSNGIKTVWTLHDYKLICPSYLCLNGKGEICEKCFGEDKSHCVKNRCIKNKFLHSFAAKKEAEKWNRERLEKCTDAFICPSNFIKQKMIQSGFSESKLNALHNFVDIPESFKYSKSQNSNTGNYYAYIGRLSKEKGVKTLCSAASRLPHKLKIIGSGPMENELKEEYKQFEQIEFLGHQNRENVLQIIANAKFTVCPSEWYEVFGLVIVESLIASTPVLCAKIGGMLELVKPDINGELFESGNEADLESKIELMFTTNFDYSFIAQNSQSIYSKEKYYQNITKIYGEKL